MYYHSNYSSPIGQITLAGTNDQLVGLWLKDQKYFGDTLPEASVENNHLELFDKTKKWLDEYFAGNNPKISELPLQPIGNEFRQTVWTILSQIPYGETITYKKIAQKAAKILGKKTMSCQAVGGAVGHNPISIIIPCHRVVGTNGSLTGFSGGIKKKIRLLELEGVDVARFKIPTKGTAL